MQQNNFFVKIILVCIMVLIGGGNSGESKKLPLPVDSERSTLLEFYYQYIGQNIYSDAIELKLPENYLKLTKPFNQQEIKVQVKGDNFLSPYVAENNRYYELGHFVHKSNTYRLIIYNKTGETDTLLLNIQLNSYDKKGNLVDALLIGSLFGYEDIVRFSDFIINPDYTIEINIHVIYKYTENEDGSIKKITQPIPQPYLKEKYQIEDGQFKLVYRNEIPHTEKQNKISSKVYSHRH